MEPDMEEVARACRELANAEFDAADCGWAGGWAGRDPAEDVRLLELELGRALTGDERRAYAVGHRCGSCDRVREEEDAADAVAFGGEELPL